MRRRSIPPRACASCRRRRLAARVLAVLGLCALAETAVPAGAWPKDYYNPSPADDDVILPMPCDGAMAFRKVFIPDQGPLNDYPISVGGTDTARGYLESVRPEYIAGSFSAGEETYYLLGKYEVTRLQYAAMHQECLEPTLQLRLPQTEVSWFDAIEFSDLYTRWLRQHAAEALPKEGKELGFARLPTEVEWEFAARGATAVAKADFSERAFPMPDGMVRYVWFAGPASANGKLQLIGLLQPNPIGLHDILGNADEMVFEPFRLNRLNRLHGQAGGYVVRGGNYFTPEQEVRTAYRQEVPYYKDVQPRVSQTTGFRLAVVAPVITSRSELKQIEEAWSALGSAVSPQPQSALGGEPLDDPVKELDYIADAAPDENMKTRLKRVNAALRASIQARDDQRKLAAKASLRLGAFLCQKLAADGKAIDALQEIVDSRRASFGDEDQRLSIYGSRLAEEQAMLKVILEYYADTLLNATAIYDTDVLGEQLRVLSAEMARKGHAGVMVYVMRYNEQLEALRDSALVAREQWLEQCKGAEPTQPQEK